MGRTGSWGDEVKLISSAPLADENTLLFAVGFCRKMLECYGLSAVYLIGSRANGSPRINSDHDILAVVSDTAPREIGTGQALWLQVFQLMCRESRKANLGPIDLIIQREGHYLSTLADSGSFAAATVNGGIRLL